MNGRRKASGTLGKGPACCTLLVLAVLAAGGCSRAQSRPVGGGAAGAGQARRAEGEEKRNASVTVLLTGFGPFGSVKQNASWQAVMGLDGKIVDGVRIRSLRLPVLWAVPLPVLMKMAEELRPRAIFSFGQGRPGAVAFEKVADNRRRSFPDNEGKGPPGVFIVEGGPGRFTSAFPLDTVMAAYRGPGVDLRTSTEAGGYLCEECLYSLEFVRASVGWKMDVAFFHFPGLGTSWKVGGVSRECDADTLQGFVLGFVRAWIATRLPKEKKAERPQ